MSTGNSIGNHDASTSVHWVFQKKGLDRPIPQFSKQISTLHKNDPMIIKNIVKSHPWLM